MTEIHEGVLSASANTIDAGALRQNLAVVSNVGEWNPRRPAPLAPVQVMHFGRHTASDLLLCDQAKVRFMRKAPDTRANCLPRQAQLVNPWHRGVLAPLDGITHL